MKLVNLPVNPKNIEIIPLKAYLFTGLQVYNYYLYKYVRDDV